MPKVRDISGIGIPGGKGLRCLSILSHRELSCSPFNRRGCEIPCQERIKFETGEGAYRQNQTNG